MLSGMKTLLPKEPLTPREALRRLQDESRLTQPQADQYLREVTEERLASEDRRGRREGLKNWDQI